MNHSWYPLVFELRVQGSKGPCGKCDLFIESVFGEDGIWFGEFFEVGVVEGEKE